MSLVEVSKSPSYVELQQRLQALVAYHSLEHGELAERLSQLLEENDCLKRRIRELEATTQQPVHDNALQPSSQAPWPPKSEAPERALGLDFSLPKR